jgi:hypothetical protein
MAEEKQEATTRPPPVSLPPDSPFGIVNEESAKDFKWKIYLYGESGSGKTFMAGTFPDPLFLDLENGMRSVFSLNKKILRYPKDPTQSITTFEEVRKFYQMVSKIKPEQAPFKTIVVDSLNELQVLIFKHIMNFQANRQMEDQPTWGDYGKLARDMQSIVRQFFQLPYNIIMTGTSADREYEEEKILPVLVGKKAGPDLRRIMEQIGYCYTVQEKKDEPVAHMVGFQNHPRYLAKDRSRKLTRPIPNTYQAMMSLINPASPNGKEPKK